MRWEDGTEKSGFNRRFLEQELLEVSAVGIPANPNALQLGLRDGAIKKSDLKEALELLCAATGGRSEVGDQRSVATNMVEEEILRAIRSVLGHEIFRGYCKQK
jgi:hypothetical protein